MPAKKNLTQQQIEAWIARKIEQKKAGIIAQLYYIGEECLNNARANHKYLSQTGNLASSIGYCVIAEGKIVSEGKWQAMAGISGSGSDGSEKGQQILRQLASQYKDEGKITMLMVAGMPYATYVEAMSLDVLESSEAMMQKKIKKMLERLSRRK
jgi:hypothetical protein